MKTLAKVILVPTALIVFLGLTGCSTTYQASQSQHVERDSLINVPGTVLRDTVYVPQYYYGGYNPDCDTAAILAGISAHIAAVDSMGHFWAAEYDALHNRFVILAGTPPQKVLVPKVYESEINRTVIKERPNFFDYLKIGALGFAVGIGLAIIVAGFVMIRFNLIKKVAGAIL